VAEEFHVLFTQDIPIRSASGIISNPDIPGLDNLRANYPATFRWQGQTALRLFLASLIIFS
jgi:hypothetical protein